MKIPITNYNDFYNGIASSRHIQKGFDNISGADVHSDIGTVTAQVALASDATSGVPTETCVQCTSPAGTVYFFSTTTGKVWKRATTGAYTSLTANANTTGHRGCRYYNGYIRYWTASKLGKFVIETEGSRNDSHGTFSNGNAFGACEENLLLFINDGKYVASVNQSETFAANALDIPPQYTGTTIIPDGFTNILIGTIVGINIHSCRAFLWDTYSDSFTLSDEVPEIGINCFINCDDMILAQCGTEGNLYQWTGQTLSLWENKLRRETTATGHQMSTILNGRPLIAAGTSVYSIHRQNSTMPRVVVQEYTATAAITSIGVSGSTLIVSVAGGVNLTGTAKAVAVIDTPEIDGTFNNVVISYHSYPEGVGIQTNTSGAGWVTQTPIIDSNNNKIYYDGGLLCCDFLQARITLTPSGTTSPVIRNIQFI